MSDEETAQYLKLTEKTKVRTNIGFIGLIIAGTAFAVASYLDIRSIVTRIDRNQHHFISISEMNTHDLQMQILNPGLKTPAPSQYHPDLSAIRFDTNNSAQ